MLAIAALASGWLFGWSWLDLFMGDRGGAGWRLVWHLLTNTGKVFERLLACRNRHGLLAEHLDPSTDQHWGNFVQTYSMVGLIASAIRLSVPWDHAR